MIGWFAAQSLRAIGWILAFLPAFARVGLGQTLGTLLRKAKWRRTVTLANLERAYPGSSPEVMRQRAELYRDSYREFGQLLLEIFLLFGPFKSWLWSHTELVGIENWKKARSAGKGVLFISSHLGNWEVMAATGAQSGIDLMIVTKRIKPDWLFHVVEASRAKCSVLATYEPRTSRDVLAHLRKNGTVGFVLDQYAGAPIGIRVPYFGTPVGTLAAPVVLARRTGAALVPVVNYRLPDGRFRVEIREPHSWISDADPERELALNTAALVEGIERDVRARPAQWLWVHRRFKGDLSPLRSGEWSEGRSRK